MWLDLIYLGTIAVRITPLVELGREKKEKIEGQLTD